MTNSVIFQDQTFVPVGTSVGLTELDGEQLIRVVKPEENTEPDVPTYARRGRHWQILLSLAAYTD